MEGFNKMYRVMKAIIANEKADEPDMIRFSEGYLKMSEKDRDMYVRVLADKGLVSGFHIIDDINSHAFPVILWEQSRSKITFDGLQYLAENSLFKKAAETANGIVTIAK